MPCSTAAIEDNLGNTPVPVFTYPNFTSGPQWLGPVTYHKRWIDEMIREVENGHWETLRSAKGIGGTGPSAKTSPNAYCNAFSTHCYTEPYRKTSPIGPNIDNVTGPGDVAFGNFDDHSPLIHNYAFSRPAPYGGQNGVFRNWLVHMTENGPGWGEADDANGIETTVGVGFVGSRPDMQAGSASKKRNILHPHEAFVYVMRVESKISGSTAWVGTAWQCGETMVGYWSLFRGFGTITDDPLHQTLASWFKWDPTVIENPPLPTRFRTKLVPVVVRGEINRTTGARTGPMANYFSNIKGYSPVDALAVI
jgi:hypothetical protein